MNMQATAPNLPKSFNKASRKLNKAKAAPPFSIRFTAEERAYLDKKSGSTPLSVYIRSKILAEHIEPRRILRQPKINETELAAVLARLGESRLASNLNQLAKAANTGTIDVSEDIEQQLSDAYDAIIAMRGALFMALGLRSGSE